MKGYVMNKTSIWTHAMKRSVGPGAKISLKELYDQYGAKHGLKEGKEFVEWLRTVKLQDHNKWNIIIEDDESITTETTEQKPTEDNINNKADSVSSITPVKLSIEDVIGMSVRVAREQLLKIKDLNLLKYALQEANQLSGKDSLCILIRKRIKDLQIAR